MIENVIKKFIKKSPTHVVEGMGMVITYKVNVNVKKKMNSYGTSEVAYIDLNIKIVDCRRKYTYGNTPVSEYNIFQLGGRARKWDYNDCRSVVWSDMNSWFAPLFSTHFYRDYYTMLCTNTQIRINTFTFK
jgi:hypothetical protein